MNGIFSSSAARSVARRSDGSLVGDAWCATRSGRSDSIISPCDAVTSRSRARSSRLSAPRFVCGRIPRSSARSQHHATYATKSSKPSSASRARTPAWWPGSSPVRTSSSLTLRRAAPSISRSTSSGVCRWGWCVANAQYLQCDTHVRESESVTLRENVTRRRIRIAVYGGAPSGHATSRSTSARPESGRGAARASARTRSAMPGPREHLLGLREAADDLQPAAERVRVARHRCEQRRAQHRAPSVGGSGARPRTVRLHLGQPDAVGRDAGAVERPELRAVRSRHASGEAVADPLADDVAQQRHVQQPERDAAAERRVGARPRVATLTTPGAGAGSRSRSITPPIGSTPVIGRPSSQCAWRGQARDERGERGRVAQPLSGRSAAAANTRDRLGVVVAGERDIEKLPRP